MAIEIERKFLVSDKHIFQSLTPKRFKQAYLNSHAQRTVRLRIEGDAAFLAIKSKTVGIERQEWEYAIPLQDAEELWPLCETQAIEKNRYLLTQGSLIWEIDEFLGDNKGLIIAEIELQTADQTFEKPDWLGEEVSNDKRYFNSQLSLQPFRQW